MRVVLLLCFVGAAMAGGLPEGVLNMVMRNTFVEACWGSELTNQWYSDVGAAADRCHNQEPMLTVQDIFGDEIGQMEPRVAREEEGEAESEADGEHSTTQANVNIEAETIQPIDLINPALAKIMPEKLVSLKESMMDLVHQKVTKLSNLTCIMRDMKMWNEDDTVNLNFLTQDMWEGTNYDEEFKAKMIEGYKRCDTYAKSIPIEELTDKQMWLKFGTRFKFQKCITNMESEVCAKKMMLDYMEDMYGDKAAEMAAELHLPKDKYEAAFMAMMIKKHAKSTEKRFAMDFIFNGQLF